MFISKSFQHNLYTQIFWDISSIITGAQGPMTSNQSCLSRTAALLAFTLCPPNGSGRAILWQPIIWRALTVARYVICCPQYQCPTLYKCNARYCHLFWYVMLVVRAVFYRPPAQHTILVKHTYPLVLPLSIVSCLASRGALDDTVLVSYFQELESSIAVIYHCSPELFTKLLYYVNCPASYTYS